MFRFTLFMTLLSLLIPGAVSAAEHDCKRLDLTQTTPEYSLKDEAQLLLAVAPDWVKDALVCVLGKYRIAVPGNGSSSTIFVWTDHGPLLMLDKKSGLSYQGVGPDRVSSEIFLNVQDRDDDGYFDQLSYSVLDSSGKAIFNVIDWDMDGQPDTRVPLNDNGKSQIWVEGAWYDLHIENKMRWVQKNGKRKQVDFTNKKWRYVD